MNRHLHLGAAAVCLPLLIGCGGGSGSTTGGTTSSTERAIQQAFDKYSTTTMQTPGQANQTMLAWFRSNPEFVESGLSGGVAWARCTDKTQIMVMGNRKVVDDNTRAAQTREAIDLPGPKAAHVFSNMGGGYAVSYTKIAAMLGANGYTVSSGASTLLNAGGDGVFYIDSHGAGKVEGGVPMYYLMTSMPSDASHRQAYTAMLNDSRMDIMFYTQYSIDSNGSQVAAARANLAISNLYVDRHWGNFGKNSFVFINACESAMMVGGQPNPFMTACMKKGASVYAGWDAVVENDHAKTVGPFVFDRLLGATNSQFPEADGPQRPFDYNQTANDLLKHGLATDGQGTALVFTPNPGTDFGLLAPTISYLGVDEGKHELTVNGVFGTEEGKVTLDGAELAVKSWGFNAIKCDLPPDISGDTIVEVRGHKSNVVQLTEWKVRFRTTYTNGFGSLRQDGTLDINFRADVHAHRDNTHEKPIDPIVPFLQEPSSSGQFTASGTWVAGPNSVETWSGEADLKPLRYQPSGNYVECFGTINVPQKRVDIALGAQSDKGMVDHATFNDPQDQDLMGDTGDLDGPYSQFGNLPGMTIPLAPDYSIPAGSRTNIKPTGTWKLEWSAVAPLHPPDPNAARSMAKRTK